jgi:hypothetical protein
MKEVFFCGANVFFPKRKTLEEKKALFLFVCLLAFSVREHKRIKERFVAVVIQGSECVVTKKRSFLFY